MRRNESLYQIADELRSVALLGLNFAENGYDKERYEQILKSTARLIALLEERPEQEVFPLLLDNLFHFSPLLAVEAAVVQEDQILLVQRRDNQLWALPGGLSEVGETLAQAAERELWEEAGLHGKVTQQLGIFDSRLWETRSKMQLFSVLFLVKAQDKPMLHPHINNLASPLTESLAVDFFPENHLPPLSPGHHLRVPLVFKLLRDESGIPVPYFDP